jgi:hypothetical protein
MAERGQETPGLEGHHLQRCLRVSVYESDLTFGQAKRIADQAACEVALHPMLLAWFERATGEHSPKVECCGDDKPAWRVYAESRGGDLTVRLNGGEYEFVYRSQERPDEEERLWQDESEKRKKG